MPAIDILIPTYNRPDALTATLTGLCAQSCQDFRVTVSDQTDDLDLNTLGTIQTVLRVLEAHGNAPRLLKHLPRRGIAEHRQFLLEQASAPYVLELLLTTIQREGCGFVGNPLSGLSYLNDVRTDEQQPFTPWQGPVQPETVEKGTPEWERWQLHNAANPIHLQEKFGFTPERPCTYHIAWIGGCVLFDRAKLQSVGGFAFWQDLPPESCGEDVLVQQRVMKHYGGCGVLPSGAYHQELPTTLSDRTFSAANLLPV